MEIGIDEMKRLYENQEPFLVVGEGWDTWYHETRISTKLSTEIDEKCFDRLFDESDTWYNMRSFLEDVTGYTNGGSKKSVIELPNKDERVKYFSENKGRYPTVDMYVGTFFGKGPSDILIEINSDGSIERSRRDSYCDISRDQIESWYHGNSDEYWREFHSRLVGQRVNIETGLPNEGYNEFQAEKLAEYEKEEQKWQRRNEKSERSLQRTTDALFEKYQEQYKDNPSLVAALTKENIRSCLEEFKKAKISYSGMDTFVAEMDSMKNGLIKNAPSMITLFMYESNAGAEKAFAKFAPETAQLEGKNGIIEAHYGDIGFNSVIKDYVRAEHEQLLEQTVEKSIADFRVSKMSLEDILENPDSTLELPEMFISFGGPNNDSVFGYYRGGNADLAVSALEQFPELADELSKICKDRISELMEKSQTWPTTYEYNESFYTGNYYFDRRDETISMLNEIVDKATEVKQQQNIGYDKYDEQYGDRI